MPDSGDILHELTYHNACRASRVNVGLTGNQSIPHNVGTILQYNDITTAGHYDNLGEWDSANYRFTPTIPSGETRYYHVVHQVYLGALTDGNQSVTYIYKNAANVAFSVGQTGASGEVARPVIRDIPMVQNDYLDFRVYHFGSVAAKNAVDNVATFVSIHRIA
jgi:hypothetical protein